MCAISLFMCGCATDFTLLIIFRLCPFLCPSPSLSRYAAVSVCLSQRVCVCSLFYTDWCIFRSVLMRPEPCGFSFGFGFGFGFGIGPLLLGTHCGFLPLAHAKRKTKKGGTRKLSFASGRKSNGTRATLATHRTTLSQRVKKV